MGLLDLARSLMLSPADRRLQAAAREAFEGAAQPSVALAAAGGLSALGEKALP